MSRIDRIRGSQRTHQRKLITQAMLRSQSRARRELSRVDYRGSRVDYRGGNERTSNMDWTSRSRLVAWFDMYEGYLRAERERLYGRASLPTQRNR